MPAATASTGAFEGRVVGALTGQFLVHAYQRGYRWGAQEVRRLLDDIQASGDATYYLQPIVVKRLGDDQWELVDGQQRLTTLYLVLQYIRLNALPAVEIRYSLEYETRPRSAEFLLTPNADAASENIDYFHMHQAWECIAEWFDGQGDRMLSSINLYKALTERVKVIWYEAPDSANSTDLFTRLNVGKIPLTDAELVKALVLSQASAHPTQTDRAQAMAAEWDAIERDLRNPEVWAFLTRKHSPEATHIMLLLETLAGGPSRRHDPFHIFETLRPRILADADAFWNEVVDLHSLVLGWYEDRDLFHKIGYLVAVGVPFAEILDLAAGTKKSEFDGSLNGRIRARLRLSREDLRDLTYETDGGRLADALLLMNVETVRRIRQSSERYSFRAHASGRWSLEHIHAQNAVELNTAEQWSEWLRLHRDALESLPNISREERADLEARIDAARAAITQELFHELEQELAPYFAPSGTATAEGDEHSISNLALLDSRDNSALNNSMFEVKRLAVLERDRAGSYIPIGTRHVFLKYYTDDHAQQLHYWSMQDRAAYLAAIEAELAPYLLDGGDE